jgi:VanZ family protein
MTASQGQTSARPLAWLYAALIVYASLYPFGPWRNQEIMPWAFIWAPRTPYWSTFDVVTNLLGYAPLGFWLTLASLRLGQLRGAFWRSLLLGATLSLCMESLQSYLPMRVPSMADWLLNITGSGWGASMALALERRGVLLRYSAMRKRWFVAQTHGALPLLATWPLALLFPLSIPLGLGHVQEKVEGFLASVLAETPWLKWMPVREVEALPLMPATYTLCVALGLVLPVLLAYSVMPERRMRLYALWILQLAGFLVTSLSGALTYGPLLTWAWLTPESLLGLVMGLFLGLATVWLSVRTCLVLLLVLACVFLALVNQAPANSYFDHNLKGWEQGRFIRFNGLAQWLGWLWPYALVADVMRRLARP